MCSLEHFCRHVTQSVLVVRCDFLRLLKTGEAPIYMFSRLVVYSISRKVTQFTEGKCKRK